MILCSMKLKVSLKTDETCQVAELTYRDMYAIVNGKVLTVNFSVLYLSKSFVCS